MADVTLFTNPMSRGRIARWMLEETGADYETRVLTYGATMKAAGYLAINPMGKVPAIVHRGTAVTEAAAVCAYLADAFPEADLAPPPAERGAYYRWLFFAAGPVEAAVTARALGLEPSPEQAATVGFGSYAAVVDALDGALSDRPYLAADTFTAADLYVGSSVSWGLAFGTMDKRPAFEAYAARVTDREAYRRATALDDADMAALQEGRIGDEEPSWCCD